VPVAESSGLGLEADERGSKPSRRDHIAGRLELSSLYKGGDSDISTSERVLSWPAILFALLAKASTFYKKSFGFLRSPSSRHAGLEKGR